MKSAGIRKRRKVFFFEKNKQKTLIRLVHRLDQEFLRRAKLTKVFCFFFSKKKILSVASPYNHHALEPNDGTLKQ